MSTIKTKVDTSEVLDFLQNNLDKKIKSVGFIKGGELSQGFYFNSKKDNYVIRVNKSKYSFEKDKYAFEHFSTKHIPIPKILKIGKLNKKYFYAISKRVNGQNLDNLSEATQLKLLPQLIYILDKVHASKINNRGKYGLWGSKGEGTFNSWKQFIIHRRNEAYSNWEKSDKSTFSEKNLVELVIKKTDELIPYLSEDAYLIHGDYGSDNVVSVGRSITGVLDWGESAYGDFIYDISWLEFFSLNIKYGKIFKQHYLKNGVNVPNYDKRLLCYQLGIGLASLGFYALSNQKKSYEWAKNKLLSLL